MSFLVIFPLPSLPINICVGIHCLLQCFRLKKKLLLLETLGGGTNLKNVQMKLSDQLTVGLPSCHNFSFSSPFIFLSDQIHSSSGSYEGITLGLLCKKKEVISTRNIVYKKNNQKISSLALLQFICPLFICFE